MTIPAELAHLPVCPHRDLPVPFIAEINPDGTGNFTVFDRDKELACLQGRLCAMCGRRMGAQVALIGDEASLLPEGFFIEPPVHERCGELAGGGVCPFLSRQRVPRRPLAEGMAVVGPGRPELEQIGRSIAKRPTLMAVTRTYQPVIVPTDTGGTSMVYTPGRLLRVRRYRWADDRLTEILPAAAGPRRQPKRASRAQRRGAR